MLFLLIFPVLVAGYRASQIHPVERLSNARHQGQRLYLSSATMGLKCFALAGLIVLGLHTSVPDELIVANWTIPLTPTSYITNSLVSMGAATTVDALHWTWFILLSVTTWFAGDLFKIWATLVLAIRYRTWRVKIPVMGKLLIDSPMDYLLFVAQRKEVPVMLSMIDRKVYVGYVSVCAEPSQNGGANQEVTIVPMMSGYRDEKTLKVTITTYYDKTDDSIELILRQDAISSAGEFNWSAFEKLQPKKPAPPRIHFTRNCCPTRPQSAISPSAPHTRR